MQRTAPSVPVSMVIVELAADWPNAPSPVAARSVIAQGEGELPRDFAQRVRTRLDQIAANGVGLEGVVLALNERLDPCARAARDAIGQAAAGALAAGRGGGLLVTAADRNSGRSRRPLTAWVAALGKQWRGRAVHCKLRFSGAALEPAGSTASPRRTLVRANVSDSVRHVA